jgi:hypothetical protein
MFPEMVQEKELYYTFQIINDGEKLEVRGKKWIKGISHFMKQIDEKTY